MNLCPLLCVFRSKVFPLFFILKIIFAQIKFRFVFKETILLFEVHVDFLFENFPDTSKQVSVFPKKKKNSPGLI